LFVGGKLRRVFILAVFLQPFGSVYRASFYFGFDSQNDSLISKQVLMNKNHWHN